MHAPMALNRQTLYELTMCGAETAGDMAYVYYTSTDSIRYLYR
jgi:hypothetical protein